MNNIWTEILRYAVANNASDVYIAPGQYVFFRRDGNLQRADFTADDALSAALLDECLADAQKNMFGNRRALDFAFVFDGVRFRANAYFALGRVNLAIRVLPQKIPKLAELGDTELLSKFLSADKGLLLVTGRTGTGKTTTLAAFLDEINRNCPKHILTLEDPVEYILPPQKSFISQREYGKDFHSFAEAVKDALREMPDIILIGEIRDAASMRAAITAAQTGVLVLGSLHTPNAAETAMRIEGMFGEDVRATIRDELASVLTATVAQRLIPAANGGRLGATQVMTGTPAVCNLIRQGKYTQLATTMMHGDMMQTFETSLTRLFRAGKITEATFAAERKNLC